LNLDDISNKLKEEDIKIKSKETDNCKKCIQYFKENSILDEKIFNIEINLKK